MPKVGNKHYAYTAAGIAKAKNAAKKLGTKLKMSVGGHIGNLNFTTTDNLKNKTARLKTKGLDACNPIIVLADKSRKGRMKASLQAEYKKACAAKKQQKGKG